MLFAQRALWLYVIEALVLAMLLLLPIAIGAHV